MAELFLGFVNISISAGWLVLAVILFRRILVWTPKWLRPVFWGLVGLRLVLPVLAESPFSLLPSAKTIVSGIMYMPKPEIHSGVGPLNIRLNPLITKTFSPEPGDSANPLQILIPVLAGIWLAGVLVMFARAGIGALRLRRRVKTAVLLEENIYQSENVSSPFVFGFLRPRIYLPFDMDEDMMYYVIRHEQMHIVRRDHQHKILGYLLLCLYWFHPLCLAAYRLFCRDIELACDEQVIKEFRPEERADYAKALLVLSTPHQKKQICPLAFGEIDVKERVKNVLHYKKPVSGAVVAGAAACIVMALCFLTNPKEGADLKENYVMKADEKGYSGGGYISLAEDGTFLLLPFMYSSHIAIGSYEVAGRRLMLWEYDRGNWYIFDMVGDTLVFDADASSEGSRWKDGQVFE